MAIIKKKAAERYFREEMKIKFVYKKYQSSHTFYTQEITFKNCRKR